MPRRAPKAKHPKRPGERKISPQISAQIPAALRAAFKEKYKAVGLRLQDALPLAMAAWRPDLPHTKNLRNAIGEMHQTEVTAARARKVLERLLKAELRREQKGRRRAKVS